MLPPWGVGVRGLLDGLSGSVDGQQDTKHSCVGEVANTLHREGQDHLPTSDTVRSDMTQQQPTRGVMLQVLCTRHLSNSSRGMALCRQPKW